MLQRIQTLYLLAAVALCFACLCLPVGSFSSTATSEPIGTLYNLWVSVLPDHTHLFAPWALFAVLLLATMGMGMAIFIYNHRLVQARLTILCCILLIGWYIIYGAFIYSLDARFEADFRPSLWAAFPAIACILGYLAFRGIIHDEALVRSYDRLR